MKKNYSLKVQEPLFSLLPDVTYAQRSYWFGGTLRPLKMDVLCPKHRRDAGQRPTLVWLCGGAFQQIDRHIWIPELVWFAKHGFTVASVEYRISVEASWPAPVDDVLDAIQYLKANAELFCVDPTRIAVMGESAGGYLACMVGTEQPCPVRAVVDYYGIVELSGLGEDDVNTGNPIALMMGVPEKGNEAQYSAASPVRRVHGGCPPFLILHGEEDSLVPVAQSEMLYAALTHEGVHAEMDVLKGVSHGADEFYQTVMKERVLRFLHNALLIS